MKILIRVALTLIVGHLSSTVWAQSILPELSGNGIQTHWQFSPYTLHYSYDTEHRPVRMVGLEREHADGKLDGLVLFSNSFGQPSAYIYPWGGVYKNMWGVAPLSFRWTAGLLYGYKPPYENKVPLNHNGLSPGAIIAFGYKFQSGWEAQLDMLGTAALMFQVNVPY
jgi:hypothetical protein